MWELYSAQPAATVLRTGFRKATWGLTARLAVLLLAMASALSAQTPAPPVTTPSAPTEAQKAASTATGRAVSNSDIADAIRRSGLSDEQVRERIRAAGYDPRLADPFFGGGSKEGASNPPDARFVAALKQMGMLEGLDPEPEAEGAAEELLPDDTPAQGGRAGNMPGGNLIFGKSVFSSRSTSFDPVLNGPVDPGYRLGGGDRLQLVLTGEVELAYTLDVRRDGTLIIPQLGQVAVAGLTLESARTAIKARAATTYSGVPEGRTRVDLSLGRIRTIEVRVIGEVENPGAYQLSALGSVFHGLARAGGPSSRGSFRVVELRRGGRVISHFDLYDFLLRGDASADVRMEQGDIIYVPLNTRRVALMGAIRRPGVYELKPNEGFTDVLRFAGGLLPSAASDRLQIDRILPAAQRAPGRERVVVDVPIRGSFSALDTLQLQENDVITAFPIGDLRRNTISIKGEVFRPGRFEWQPGLTLAGAIGLGQGIPPWGARERIKVIRSVPTTGRQEIFSLDLRDSTGANFPIAEFDEITILDARLEQPSGTVKVSGAVNRPGERPYAERMSLSDLIDMASGFTETASRVEVARKVLRAGYTDTVSVLHQVVLGPDRRLSTADGAFVLERGDEVSVRSTPGAREFGVVVLRGQFAFPGVYAIQRNDERLSDVIARAGGVLPTASAETFKLIRGGRTVAVSFSAVAGRDRHANLPLQADDELVILERPTLVYVSGAVERRVAVPFRQGWTLDDYLNAAGGVSDKGRRSNTIVEYPNGSIGRTRRTMRLIQRDPEVLAGATITVPEKPPEREGAFRDSLTLTAQLASVIASLALGLAALR